MKLISNEKEFKESILFDALLIKNIKMVENDLRDRIKLKDNDIKSIIKFIKLKYSEDNKYDSFLLYNTDVKVFLLYIFYKVLEKIKFPIGYGTVFVTDDCKAFLTHSIERIKYYRNTYGIIFAINDLPIMLTFTIDSVNSFLRFYKDMLDDIIATASKLYAYEFFKQYSFIMEDEKDCFAEGCIIDISKLIDSIVFAINMIIKYDRFIEGDVNNDTCT